MFWERFLRDNVSFNNPSFLGTAIRSLFKKRDRLSARSRRRFETQIGECLESRILLYALGSRWSTTATNGSGLTQGAATTVTWGIVPDGTPIGALSGLSSESTDPSNLVAFMGSVYGTVTADNNYTDEVWFVHMKSVYDRWSELSGISFVYVAYDDGSALASAAGVLGTRADVRIGGHRVDGNSGVLAYNFYPNNGDMVIDTADTSYPSTGNAIRLRNVMAHESGHGLGLQHVVSSTSSILMKGTLSTSFDGPQYDDILGLQRHYGDVYEKNGGNDTYTKATSLGSLALGQTITIGADAAAMAVLPSQKNFVSIDDELDADYFSFTTTSATTVTIQLTPLGPAYNVGTTSIAETSFNAAAQNDLSLNLYGTNGTTVLATANAGALGVAEAITSFSVAAAGTYYIKVSGSTTDKVQTYRLGLSDVSTAAQSLVVSSSSVAVTEGSTNTFTVKLSTQPTTDVNVTVARASGDTDLTVSGGASLTFTSANWNTPQTVTLAAAQDVDTANSSAVFNVTSTGLTTVSVTGTEADNDTQALVVSLTSVAVTEGATNTFTVKLAFQPASNVTVSVARASGDADLSVSSGASLTFTSANWNTPQTVTLAAAEDDDLASNSAVFDVTSTGLAKVSVTGSEADNDTQALVVSTSSLDVTEGATSTFTVKLAFQPASDVAVSVGRVSGDADLSVSGGATLTFTSVNWNTPQTITLAAAEDVDLANSSAVFDLTSTGLTTVSVTGSEADNDTQAMVVSSTSVSVTEGLSNTFTVKLAFQPASDVTVSVARVSGDSDLTVSGGATLTFTSANWNTAQTVTLAAAQDVDLAHGSAVFDLTSTDLTTVSVTGTEEDNDSQSLVLSSTTVSVGEGATSTFTVKLAFQPASDVTVSVARASGDANLTVSGGASLTFTSTNWNTPQTVTLAAAQDVDLANGSAVFDVTSAGLTTVNVTGAEADNDTQALVVSASSVSVTEGSTNTFTVKLAYQPASNVTVSVARASGDADLTVSGGATLTFTSTNWNTLQTVTLAAAEDVDTANGSAVFDLTSTGLTTVSVTGTEADNDAQSLVVSSTSVSVGEGATNTFTVKLSTQPASDVTVTVARASGDADLSVSGGATLTFTSANWNTPQTVTLAAAQDLDTVNDSAAFDVASTDLTTVSVTGTEADNDTQALVVSATSVSVTEGATSTFTVKLAFQPASDVTVSVARASGDADLTVSGGATLTFTSANWNTTQTVTLAAAQDVDLANSSAVFDVTSTGLTTFNVTGTETDNDTQSLVVLPTSISVDEGATSTFTVKLAYQPASDVNVSVARVSGDADLTVSGGATLTFTSANWNTTQTVTLAAAQDVDTVNGSAVFDVTSAGLATVSLTGTETDNDSQSLVVSSTSVSVTEGTTSTFTVKLAYQPTSNVTVSVARVSGDTDLTVSGGATLTFTSANWNTTQTVTLAAAQDVDTVNGSAVFDVTSTGLNKVSVTGSEADNDTQALVVSASNLSVTEGSTNTFTVKLAFQPASNVAVSVARASGDADLSVSSGASLTFTSANWNTPQTVTLAAAQDVDLASGSAVFDVTSTGLAKVSVTGSEADNDTQALVASASSLSVTEGATSTFTVKLAFQPASDVTVSVGRVSGDADLSVSGGATLTFTSVNWNTPQTITLAAAEDVDLANSSAVFDLTSTGLTTVSVTGSEADNDTQAMVVSSTSVSVAEGATSTFTVKLAFQPASDVTVSVARVSGDSDLTVSNGATLTFTSTNWNTTQTVTLAAAQDVDLAHGSAVFDLTSTGLTTVSVTGTETDNDSQSLVLSSTSVSVTEGLSNTFTVKLAFQPASDVTVSVARVSGDSDLTVSGGATLTFTSVNWNTPQTVTLAAAQDVDLANGSAVFDVTSTGLTTINVTGTESDNDTQALVVSTSTLAVTEGATKTFTVKLAYQPASNVTVSVARASGDTDLTVSGGATLTFTSANWNTAQTVTLAAAEDVDLTSGSAVFGVTSTGLTTINVTGTEADNDTQALVVSASNLSITEGTTSTFTVKLAYQPASNVTVSVAKASGDADLTVSGGATLTFTSANWNTPQTVTLAAAQDVDTVNGSAVFGVTSTGLTTINVTGSESDNDMQAMVVSASNLSVTEGATNTFTVKLAYQPASNVTVSVARASGDSDLTVSGGATLTFTSANWNTTQTVTLAAAQDVDLANSSAVFDLTSTGLTTVSVTGSEADNDTQALIVSSTSLSVAESATSTFTVKLAYQPASDVTVSVAHVSGDADLSVSSGSTLTFTAANWNTPQTVTLAAAEDLDALNGSAVFDLTSLGLTTLSVTGIEADNDSQPVVDGTTQAIVVSSINLSVTEGSTSTFTVRLAMKPTKTVSVSVGRPSGDSDLSVLSGASLKFTTSNWNTPQTVTLAAAEDVDTANGSAVFKVTSSGLTAVSITGNEAENDTQALVVSSAEVFVTEGSTKTFTVKLAYQPSSILTVSVGRTSGDGDLTVRNGASLSFTPTNWNKPQTVTLAAAEDMDTANGSAAFDVASTGLVSVSVRGTEVDNDTQALVVSSTSVSVAEGDTSTFTVNLAYQPTSDVTVAVAAASGDTDLSVNGGAILTFTSANWNTPQIVTLAAAEDADTSNGSAVLNVASAGLSTRSIAATEVDNDTQALLVSSSDLFVTEDATNTFTVRLAYQPAKNITVAVARASGNSNLIVGTGRSLTFTPSNWNRPQTVSVKAEKDVDTVNGSAIFKVTSKGLAPVSVTSVEADSDTQALVVSSPSVLINEGGTKTFTVKLAYKPQSNVVVSVARTSGDTDLAVRSGMSLTFTPSNWKSAQTVTLAASEDMDIANGSAVLDVTATGLATIRVTGTEADNDTQALVVSAQKASVTEGSTSTFTVRLAYQPSNEVTVSVAPISGDNDLTVSGGSSLAFNASNWNTPQTVTVAAAEDVDMTNGSAVLNVTSFGLKAVSVTGTEVDNDKQALRVSTDGISVAEGGTSTFAVKLACQPVKNVSVSVARASGNSSLTVQGGRSLTFTPSNWNTPQTVTLAAAEDGDLINGSAVFKVTSSGLATAYVTSAEADNDAPAFLLSTATMTEAMGAKSTINAGLSYQSPGGGSGAVITWQAVKGAVRYELWVTNLTSLVREIYVTNLTGTRFSPASLTDGSYRAWVRAVHSTGEISLWSTPIDFKTGVASAAELDSLPEDRPFVASVNMHDQLLPPQLLSQLDGSPEKETDSATRSHEQQFTEELHMMIMETLYAQESARGNGPELSESDLENMWEQAGDIFAELDHTCAIAGGLEKLPRTRAVEV